MKTNFFKKLFYPPQYLSMKVAGLDIRNGSIRYVEFTDAKGNFSIRNSGRIALPAHTVKDGDILDKDALVKALSELKGKISADAVKLSIAEEKTYIFDTQVPLVKGASVRESIEFKLEENVPLKADEVFFQYETVKKEGRGENGTLIASVSVIPKATIEDLAEVCSLAGLSVAGFEMESRMIARSVVPSADPRALMLINVKDDSTLLSLVVGGIVRFTSTIALGESAMKESLAKADAMGEEAHYSLANVFSVVKDEIEKFNEYLLSTSDGKSIPLPSSVDEIILSGEGASLPGFADQIGQNINAKITLANVWSNVFDVNVSLPKLAFADSLDFAAAIGLAIPS